LKDKYNESLKLYDKMHSDFPHKRLNCEDILERKNSWALKEEELEINDQLENIIASMLRSEINLNENSSSNSISGAETLKKSRAHEQRDEVSHKKRRTQF
jgi:hypothetical protein